MTFKKTAAAILGATLITGSAFAMKPVTLVDQGSFWPAGLWLRHRGTMWGRRNRRTTPVKPCTATMPTSFIRRRRMPTVRPSCSLHGHGQSAKTWETTPDGRDGFRNIFLEKRYKTYLVDEPRRGRAGRSTVATSIGCPSGRPVVVQQLPHRPVA